MTDNDLDQAKHKIEKINEVAKESGLVNQVPLSILVNLERAEEPLYVSQLREVVDTTYAHLVKQINRLEDLGFIDSQKKGRRKYIEITDSGVECAQSFEKVIEVVIENQSSSDSVIEGK